MYESFFNLTSKPFELLPNPAFLFLSKSHKRAITYLDYGMRERAGFILLTGAVGSGKTTIIRDLVKRDYDNVIFSKVFNTHVNFEQLIAMINDDFGLPVQGKDKVALLRDLNDFLIQEYAKGNKPTLIIDEAQNLSHELLEEIRMLSNLEMDNAKLLQIILVGQPELRRTLAAPSLLQLRQRMGINCHIQPLSRPEIDEYIYYRLEVAGNRNAVTLTNQALDVIYKFSRGIPRLVNIICDFLMLAAFAEETTKLDEVMVRDVIGDLDFENQFWRSFSEKTGEQETTTLPATVPVLAEEHAVIVQNDGECIGILQTMGQRFETMERVFLQFQQNYLNELGRTMRSNQDNRSALKDIANMVSALGKDMANNTEELTRLREIVVELTDFLSEYFASGRGEKTKEGMLRKMLRK